MKTASIVKDAMILTIITLVAGLALGYVYEITKSRIEAANQAAIEEAYHNVFEEAETFTEIPDFDEEAASEYIHNQDTGNANVDFSDVDIDNAVEAEDSSGEDLGYVITTTSHKGYGGDITLSVGITMDGNMNGYSITDISETPGLGMKSTEEKFKSQFDDIEVGTYEVTKTTAGENQIEAISGATITSRAVTNSVDAAMAYFEELTGGEGE